MPTHSAMCKVRCCGRYAAVSKVGRGVSRSQEDASCGISDPALVLELASDAEQEHDHNAALQLDILHMWLDRVQDVVERFVS